jgi:hypothetical protein
MGQRALLFAAALLVCSPANSAAYSVLAHEALIDGAWQAQIAPMLLEKFPSTSEQELQEARAYAYGGSLIQDLGYYPFGSRFFSNLVHYVRSGDFVSALIRESQDVDEYAFALGALAHYASDTAAHPTVNHVVPMVYPELRTKFGDEVLFGESKARHVMVEFSFDVFQVARGRFNSDAYQHFIGFEVARPLLERVFAETYGLELKDVFGDVGLAIGTYRRATSVTIPDVTRAAWREKRDEIFAANPDITERDVVYTMTRQEYEKAYGTGYRRPGLLVRFMVAVFKVLPKFGPFKPLAFEPLTAETGRMFLESFDASGDRYRTLLLALRKGQPMLVELDLDTGARPRHGVNEIADEAYADLLAKLRRRKFAGVSPELRHALAEHYADPSSRDAATSFP